jgi:hypothetical protein
MHDFPSRQRENDSVATFDPDVCMRLFSTMLVRMMDYG